MSANHDMWIAPKRGGGNWTVSDWQQLNLGQADSGDWETAIQIFEDRTNFRFVDAIETLKQNDDEHYGTYKTRRFGFAAVALMSLLMETLAQFYAGKKESPTKYNNVFYTHFLSEDSLFLKRHFQSCKAMVFYKTIRCGILHQAETKENSLIRYRKEGDINYEIPFEKLNEDSMIVYWAALFNLLKQEIAEYTKTLRLGEDQDRRNKFKTKMDFICRSSKS